jgi:hypothetical protein
MSELYLVLRRRLEAVAEWVQLGTDEMQAAQDRLGLSNERLAAELYVVSKTWERWKQRGMVPRHQLANVAEVLGLEVETPAPVRVTPVPRGRATRADQLDQIDERLARIEEALGIARSGRGAPRAVRGEDA